MRATLGDRRTRTRRKLAAIAAASLFALSMLGSGTVTGANSRTLYIGTDLVDANGVIIDNVINLTGLPGQDGIPDNAGPEPGTIGNVGVLIPTPVNAGFSTAVPIQILNGGNQTLAHVLLSFPITGTSLTSGLTITDIGGTNAASCWKVFDGSTPPAVTGVSCNFDNLAAGAVRSFFVVVAVSSTFDTTQTNLFTASVTTNNENGSNLQYFTASSGSFQVLATNPDGLSTFVPPGQLSKSFSTDAVVGSNKLQTKLDFTQSAGGNLVAIAEDNTTETTYLYKCPSGLTCQPVETTITIQDGLSGTSAGFSSSPFLTVTLTALVPKTYTLSKAFVAHYGTDATVPDWILYWGTKSTRCGADIAAKLATIDQCFNSATLSKPDATGNQTLVLQFVAKGNGGNRY